MRQVNTKQAVFVLIMVWVLAMMAGWSRAEVSVIDLTQITSEVRGGTFIPFTGGGMYAETHIPVIRVISPSSEREYFNLNAIGVTLKKLDNDKIQGKFSPSYTFRIDSLLQKLQEMAGGWLVSAKLPPLELGISSILDLTPSGKICAEWGFMGSLKFGGIKK